MIQSYKICGKNIPKKKRALAHCRSTGLYNVVFPRHPSWASLIFSLIKYFLHLQTMGKRSGPGGTLKMMTSLQKRQRKWSDALENTVVGCDLICTAAGL